MEKLSSAHMPELAQEFLTYARARGLALDGTSRTMPLLDAYMANLRRGLLKAAANQDPKAEEEFDQNCQWIAGYVGAIIQAQTNAVWSDARGNPTLDLGGPWIPPLQVIAELLASGETTLGTTTLRTPTEFCTLAISMHREWLERVVTQGFESMAALEAAMTPDRDLARWLVAHAQIAVQGAKLQFGHLLDFSPESVKHVEEILGARYEAFKESIAAKQVSEQALSAVINVWGSYLGEVFRRHYGGQWARGDNGPSLTIGQAKIFPLSKVYKRLVEGPGDNVQFYFHAVGKVLSGELRAS
jgi:hypothetical protein